MAAMNRTAILTKIHKALKKHYTPTVPNLKLPLLEQLLLACCLEDAPPAAAEKAMAALDEQYFDLNEVRVSTVTELSETLSMLPESAAAASRVKRTLQSVFEATYSFDLESLKKQNIGAAQKRLAKFDGISSFAVAYATQTALGGHSVPLAGGALHALYVLGAISEKERAAGVVPGLERAIAKNKGHEFGSLINQLGVEFGRNPFAPNIRKLLMSIVPDAKDRFPKRAVKAPPAPPAPPTPPPAPVAKDGKAPAGAAPTSGKKAPPPAVGKKPAPPAPAKPAPAKPAAAKPKPAPLPPKKGPIPARKPTAPAARKPAPTRVPPRKPR
ncbi:MAG: hypothetical protein K8T25_20930 [Planctomycetia bacterium]|nr:hypothetical protein [Planctomycetia bacterium]